MESLVHDYQRLLVERETIEDNHFELDRKRADLELYQQQIQTERITFNESLAEASSKLTDDETGGLEPVDRPYQQDALIAKIESLALENERILAERQAIEEANLELDRKRAELEQLQQQIQMERETFNARLTEASSKLTDEESRGLEPVDRPDQQDALIAKIEALGLENQRILAQRQAIEESNAELDRKRIHVEQLQRKFETESQEFVSELEKNSSNLNDTVVDRKNLSNVKNSDDQSLAADFEHRDPGEGQESAPMQDAFDDQRCELERSEDTGIANQDQQMRLELNGDEAPSPSSMDEAQRHVIYNLSGIKREKKLVSRVARIMWPFRKRN